MLKYHQLLKEIQSNKIEHLTLSPMEVLDYDNMSTRMTLSIEKGNFTALAALPNNQLVSGSDDEKIRIWDLQTQACIKVLLSNVGTPNIFKILSDGRLVVGGKKGIQIWNLQTYRSEQKMKSAWYDVRSNFSIYTLAVLSDNTIVSPADGYGIKLWNPNTGQCIKTFKGHTDWVRVLGVLSDDRIVSASMGRDDGIRIWNQNSENCLQELKAEQQDLIRSFSILPDDIICSLYTAYSAESGEWDRMCLWNADNGQCLSVFKEDQRNLVNDTDINYLGSWNVRTMNDGTVVLRSRDSNKAAFWNPYVGYSIGRVHEGNNVDAVLSETSLASIKENQIMIVDVSKRQLQAKDLAIFFAALINNTSVKSINIENVALDGGGRGFWKLLELREQPFDSISFNKTRAGTGFYLTLIRNYRFLNQLKVNYYDLDDPRDSKLHNISFTGNDTLTIIGYLGRLFELYLNAEEEVQTLSKRLENRR